MSLIFVSTRLISWIRVIRENPSNADDVVIRNLTTVILGQNPDNAKYPMRVYNFDSSQFPNSYFSVKKTRFLALISKSEALNSMKKIRVKSFLIDICIEIMIGWNVQKVDFQWFVSIFQLITLPNYGLDVFHETKGQTFSRTDIQKITILLLSS